MSDATTQQIESLMAEVGKLKTTMGSLGDSMAEKDKAERKLSRDLAKKTQGAATALTELMTSAEGAGHFFRNMLGDGLIGGTFRALIDIGTDMAKTYRVMNAHGEQFGGSMLNMSIAAAQAGLPLSEFADAVTMNSFAMKRMGDKDFPGLQRELRTSMMEASNFGMTMSGVTKFSAGFWETTRRTGMLEHMSKQQLVKQTYDLADVTQTMSKQTGKATEAIADLTNSAITNSLAASRIASMTSAQGIAANAKLNKNISVLAAQAGEAGEFLSSLAAESYGMDGFAEFTSQGQTLIAAGMGHLANSFDAMDSMSPEQTAQKMNDFRNEIGRNLPNLRDLAKSTGAGSAEARQLLKVYGEMKDVSIAELRQREKNKDGMTKFFLVIETLWNQVSGSFREGFLKGFKPLFASVGDITKSKRFEYFAKAVGRMGEALGGVIAGLLSEDNLKNFGDKLGRLADSMMKYDWAGAFSAIWDFFADINWSDVGKAFKSAINFGVEVAKLLGPFAAFLPILFVGKMLLSPFTMLLGSARTLGGLFGGLVKGFTWLGRALGLLEGGAAVGGAAAGAGGLGAAGAGAAGAAGLGSKLLKGGGRLLGGVGGGLMMYDGASSVNTDDKVDKAMGYGESALGGAMLGATIGSIVPVVGTAVGAAVGGGIGLLAAGISDWWSDDAKSASDSIAGSQETLEKQAAAMEAERAAKADKPDPALSKLDMLIAQQKIQNDLMIAAAQTHNRSATDQTRLLNRIAKKEQ